MNVLFDVLRILFKFFGVFLLAVAACVIPFLLSVGVCCLVSLAKGKRIKKRTVKRITFHYSKPINSIIRLFIDFPRQLVSDIFGKDPDGFDTFGVHIFAGEQGSGKSIAAVHFIKMIKERNPACRIASNISINFQDAELRSWEDILNYNNGNLGQVIFIDEIQNWFSSNESRNFPPEMLTEITQQRKQRKIVVGTSQVFTRLSKPIREQITKLYCPITIAGCLTFVRVYRLKLKEDGTVDQKRLVNVYFFVQDNELRSAYDTYEKVQRLSISGFKDPQSDVNRMSSGSLGFAPIKQEK